MLVETFTFPDVCQATMNLDGEITSLECGPPELFLPAALPEVVTCEAELDEDEPHYEALKMTKALGRTMLGVALLNALGIIGGA